MGFPRGKASWPDYYESIVPEQTSYPFDDKLADDAVAFFENGLTHVKGELAGKPLLLEGWERKYIRELFGRLNHDGTRLYRESLLAVPRKNGKTTTLAGLGVKLLTVDGEPGAEIYSAAGDREQAAIAYATARTMVENSPDLLAAVKVYQRHMTYPVMNGLYRVLSADARTKHGFNAHGILFDELHTQPNRELYEVLSTSTGSRRSPLHINITTAGWDRDSICYEVWSYAQNILDGVFEDPTFLPVIYAADKQDDWLDPDVWRKANPNLGVSVSEDYIARAARKAKEVPANQNAFQRLHLNIWTQQATRWLDMDVWGANATAREVPDKASCIIGLDLSSVEDMTAAVAIFVDGEGYVSVKPHFWIPEKTVERYDRTRVAPYRLWVEQGYLNMTPGEVVDYDSVRATINQIGQQYKVREIVLDRWNATDITSRLQNDGFTVIPWGQGMASMSPASKEFLRLLLERKLAHASNPVLTWMAGNAAIMIDAAENIKPAKDKSSGKIDGIVALIMACGRFAQQTLMPNVYHRRGMRSV